MDTPFLKRMVLGLPAIVEGLSGRAREEAPPERGDAMLPDDEASGLQGAFSKLLLLNRDQVNWRIHDGRYGAGAAAAGKFL